jgi:hypothetical protein
MLNFNATVRGTSYVSANASNASFTVVISGKAFLITMHVSATRSSLGVPWNFSANTVMSTACFLPPGYLSIADSGF